MPEQKNQIQLVARGGSLKALANGKVLGQGVMFTSAQKKDLTGDYFDTDTDFMWEGKEKRAALYHHGLDPVMGTKLIGDGWNYKGKDSVSLWVEDQLNMRDEYEKAIYELSEQNKMGLSSGTASHMIIRNDDGKLVRWPIVEISYTPTPAEPTTSVSPIRSIKAMGLEDYFKLVTNKSIKKAVRGGRIILSPWQKSYIKQSIKEVLQENQVINEDQSATSPDYAVGNSDVDLVNEVMRDTNLMDQLVSVITGLVPALSVDQAAEIIKNVLEQLALTEPTEGAETEPQDQSIQDLANTVAGTETAPAAKNNYPKSIQRGNKMAPQTPVTRSRPPYNFQGQGQPQVDPRANAVKDIYKMQFGELQPAVKAIASDLYGSEDRYHEVRSNQLKAFTHFIRHGDNRLPSDFQKVLKTVILTPSQIKSMAIQGIDMRAVKANFSEIIDTLGGWLVPEDIRLDMVERLPASTIIRPLADVTTTSSDVMVKVKITGGTDRYVSGVRVTWVGDTPAKDAADTSTTFGVVQTPIHIAKATVPVPMALLEDSAYPLVDKINEWVSNAYAQDEDEQFLIGDGIATPLGILPGETNANSFTEVTSAGVTILPDSLKNLKRSIARQYRAGAVWIMNEDTIGYVDKIKDLHNRYLWQDSLQASEPDTLLGFPVMMSLAMPDVAALAYPIVFCNPKGYQIADRIGMSVVRDDVTEAEEDLVKFMFRRRLGGQPSSDWMFAALKVTA